MHHKLESPDGLQIVQNEFTAEITGIIDSLQQGTHPETGKETPFDKALDRFLESFFIKHAKLNNACYVPLKLPDVSSNLSYLNPDYVTQPPLPADDSNGSENAITPVQFWQNIAPVHKEAILLNKDPDVYVVPLRPLHPNQNRLLEPQYARESIALHAAHFQTASLARTLVMEYTNRLELPPSQLPSDIQSLQDTLIWIIQKKANAGRCFIEHYLNIIAPASSRSLDQYQTVGEMLAQKKIETTVQQNPNPRPFSKTKCDTSQGQHTNNGHPNDGSVNVPLATKRGGEENWDNKKNILTNTWGLPELWVDAYKWHVQKTPEDQTPLQSPRLTAQACYEVCTQSDFTEIVGAYRKMMEKQQG